MRHLITCIFATMILSQAVESLTCYHCPNGGRCRDTRTCANNVEECITYLYYGPGTPRYWSRCSTPNECVKARILQPPYMTIRCCGTDLCNG